MKFGYLKGHGRHFWKSHNFEKEIAFCERTYVVSPLSDKKKLITTLILTSKVLISIIN